MNKEIFAESIIYRALSIAADFGVGYFLTDSLFTAGKLVVLLLIIKTLIYYFFRQYWENEK